MIGNVPVRRSAEELQQEAAALASTVTSEELEEFKRVFAIVDTDGSGTITLNELQQLMQNLRGGRNCSRAEVALVQEAIDADKNESISLDEFIQALTRWTASSKGIQRKASSRASKSGMGLRRRSSSGDVGDFGNSRTREEIVADIAAFFNQFEQIDWNTKLQRVREKFQQAQNSGKMSAEEGFDSFWLMGREPKVVGPDQRLQFIESVRQEIAAGHLQQQIQALRGGQSIDVRFHAMNYVSQIMAILDVFPTPSDRWDVAEVIFMLFKQIRDGDVVTAVLNNFLTLDATNGRFDPETVWKVQSMALDFLFLYLPGPRVAHTPVNNEWHTDRMTTKKDALKAKIPGVGNTVQVLMQLLAGSSVTAASMFWGHNGISIVVKKCIQVLGAFAAHDEEARSALVDLGVLKLIIDSLNPRQDMGARSRGGMHPEVAAGLMWTLCILCGHTHAQPIWEMGGGPFKRLLDCGVWPRLIQVIQTCDPTGRNNHLPAILCKPLPPGTTSSVITSCITQAVTCCFIGITAIYPGVCENIQPQRLKIILTRALQYISISAKVLEDSEDRGSGTGDNISGLQARSDLMRCVLSAMKCVESILVSDENRGAELLHNSNLPQLIEYMLESKAHGTLRKAAAELLSAVCTNPLLRTPILRQKGMVRLILQMMNNDSELQSRASNILFQLSRKASLRELRDMVNMGFIEGLMSCVTKFKTQDEVTSQKLNYSGDTFNFALVRNSLKMLSIVAQGGEEGSVNTLGSDGNEFIRKFNLGHIGNIEQLLNTIVNEVKTNSPQRWALAQGATGVEHSVEGQARNFLNILLEMHRPHVLQGNQFSSQIVQRVQPMVQTLDGLFRMSQMKNGPGGMAIDNINGMVAMGVNGQMMGMGMGMSIGGQVMLGMQQIPVQVVWSVHGQRQRPQQIEGIPSNLPIMRLKKHLTMNSPGGDQITEIQYHDFSRQPPVWIECSTQDALQTAINGALSRRRPIEFLATVRSSGRGGGGRGGYGNSGGFGGVDDLPLMMKNMRRAVNATDLNRLWKVFKRAAIQNGVRGIQRREFVEILCREARSDRRNAEKLFSAMDADGGGSVDIKELAMAWSLMFSPKDKINILFDAFDFDESGSLDPREVTKMIEMISNTSFQDAQQMAQQVFQMVDEDRSGDIDINELFRGMNGIPQLQQILMNFSMQ
eukprot:g6670.t1